MVFLLLAVVIAFGDREMSVTIFWLIISHADECRLWGVRAHDSFAFVKREGGDVLAELVKIGAEQGPAAMDRIGWAIMKFVVIYKLSDIAAEKFSKLVDLFCAWIGRRLARYFQPENPERTRTPAMEANARNGGNDEENNDDNQVPPPHQSRPGRQRDANGRFT